MKSSNLRLTCAQILDQVILQGSSLSTALPAAQHKLAPQDRALCAEISFGVLRHYRLLESALNKLLQSPIKPKESTIKHLAMAGIYQLLMLETADYAVINETVNGAKTLGKSWATGLLNAVLRQAQRTGQSLLETDKTVIRHSAPDWLAARLKRDWPEQYEAILQGSQQRPPMTLRVNLRLHTREQYSQLLNEAGIDHTLHAVAPAAIELSHPCAVEHLPGFVDGWVSVQDAAAQLSGHMLSPRPAMKVLDACSAPGGKTCQMLEETPDLAMTALDNDPERLKRVEDNLHRLKLDARLLCADASAPETWWDGQSFDRILLDVPCSATGVIRRHPDIKWLRRDSDIADLVRRQGEILRQNWSLLKPGGLLMYTTCSILKTENEQQIARFLRDQADAREVKLELKGFENRPYGIQILPGEQNMDGFYYCLLLKTGG